MGRTAPEDRLEALIEAAAEVFCERGYRRTQMADVAKRLGVATGTLYNYVEGKEALFDLCVQRAFLETPPPGPPVDLPVPTPPGEAVVAHARARLAAMGGYPLLRAAADRERPDDPAAELAALVAEQYDYLSRNWRALRLLERSTADRPELAFGRRRGRLVGRWAGYLERRIEAGFFRPVPDTAVAARFIIEICAWFAWHRHGDPAPAAMDEAVARETVVLLCSRALVKEPR